MEEEEKNCSGQCMQKCVKRKIAERVFWSKRIVVLAISVMINSETFHAAFSLLFSAYVCLFVLSLRKIIELKPKYMIY